MGSINESVPIPAKRNDESLSCSPVPGASTSTSSELSFDLSDQEEAALAFEMAAVQVTGGKAGEVPPNSTYRQRHLSPALVTDPEVEHEILEGRPRVVLPRSGMNLRVPSFKRAVTEVMDPRLSDFTLHPPPMRLDAWAEAAASSFKVRGQNYLNDRKKYPSEESLFKLLTVDLVKVDKPNYEGMCSHPNERIQMALRKEQEMGIKELPPFIFAVNLCVPGQSYYHWVAYFGLDDLSVIKTDKTPLARLASQFFFGKSDSFRNETFKLIPRIAEGNFVVRKAVGSKPSILGSKLKQYYILDKNHRFFELIVDIASDPVAQKIVKLALGYAKTLTVDMMFLLEGRTQTELPERILGGVQMKNLDFKKKDGQRRCPPPP